MNRKQLLRFYFSAEVLDGAFDRLIDKYALSSADFAKGTEYYADKIIGVIEAKSELAALWTYLDKIMSGMTAEERKILRFYGKTRCGIARLPEESRKEIKRTAVKYMRRARSVERYGEAISLVKKYYCLM